MLTRSLQLALKFWFELCNVQAITIIAKIPAFKLILNIIYVSVLSYRNPAIVFWSQYDTAQGWLEIDLTLISCAFCLIPVMSCQWPAITTYPSKNWTIFCPNKCLRSELIQFHCHTTRQNNVTLISFSLLRWSRASVFLSWSSHLSTSIYRAKGHQLFSSLCMKFFEQEILQIFVVFLHTFGHEHFVSCKANKEKWQILKKIAWEKLHWADTWYLGVEREASWRARPQIREEIEEWESGADETARWAGHNYYKWVRDKAAQ